MVTSVVPFPSGRRLNRGNAVRSSFYSSKARGLPDGRSGQKLQIMEAKLFGEAGQRQCCDIKLPFQETEFTCSEGSIYYYFSDTAGKYILLDFYFNQDGSGGGLPEPSPSEFRSYGSLAGSRPFRSRLVAKVASSLAAVVSEYVSGMRALHRNFSRGAFVFWAENFFSSEQVSVNASRAWLIASLYEGVRSARPLKLPAWSVLSPFVRTDDQIQNSYARAILTGEALCQLTGRKFGFLGAKQSGDDDCEWAYESDVLTKYRSYVLLSDSKTVIHALCRAHDFTAANEIEIGFSSLGTITVDWMADDRAVALLRGELTYKLAGVVYSWANKILKNANRRDIDSELYGRVMRKYAVLSDFASTFSEICRAPVVTDFYDIEELVNSNVGTISRNNYKAVTACLARFDRLAAQVASSSAKEGESLKGEDVTILRDRCLDLTAELLDLSA